MVDVRSIRRVRLSGLLLFTAHSGFQDFRFSANANGYDGNIRRSGPPGIDWVFRREAGKVALWSIPIIGIQLLANILLTYQWVDPAGMWLFFANTITIPLGILWYFILRSRSVDEEVESTSASWSIPAVFNTTLSRVVGILILLVSCVLIFYRLGYYDIWEDENLVINAAKGVYEQGVAYFKDGYDRAWIHTLLCAGVFEVFGVSEFTGRIPSAIFGIVFVLVCFYVFARWYGLAWLALLIPLICLMNDRF